MYFPELPNIVEPPDLDLQRFSQRFHSMWRQTGDSNQEHLRQLLGALITAPVNSTNQGAAIIQFPTNRT